jgi:hypothetical protein
VCKMVETQSGVQAGRTRYHFVFCVLIGWSIGWAGNPTLFISCVAHDAVSLAMRQLLSLDRWCKTPLRFGEPWGFQPNSSIQAHHVASAGRRPLLEFEQTTAGFPAIVSLLALHNDPIHSGALPLGLCRHLTPHS